MSSYNRDLKLYKKLKARKNFLVFVSTLAILSATVGISIAVVQTVLPDKTFSLAYTCKGVDSVWLETHPFVTETLPTSATTKERTFLETPEIDGYSFKGWHMNDSVFKVNKKGIRPSKLRDDSKPLILSAEYEAIEYTVSLHLDGGKLGVFDKKYDGHEYSSRKENPVTTFTCVDSIFDLPIPKKSGYTFNPNGWRIIGETDAFIMQVRPYECRSLELAAEWISK